MGFMHKLGLRPSADYDKLKLKLDAADQQERRLRDIISDKDDEISKLLGARRIDGETVKQLEAKIDGLNRKLVDADAKFKKAVKDLAAASDEISTLRPLADATLKRRANDAKRVRPSRAKPKAPAKGVGK